MSLLYFQFMNKLLLYLWAELSLRTRARSGFAGTPQHFVAIRSIPLDQSLLLPEESAVSLPKQPSWMDRFWRKKERRHAMPSGTDAPTCIATHFCLPTFVQVEVERATLAKSFTLDSRQVPPEKKELLLVSIIPTPGISQTLAFLEKGKQSYPVPPGAQGTAGSPPAVGLPALLCLVTFTYRISLWTGHCHTHFTNEEMRTYRLTEARKL